MLTVKSFFNLTDFSHRQIFPRDEHVWTGLNRLKEYMDRFSYTMFNSFTVADGVPLPQTVILHEKRILQGSDVSITYGDTTKGTLVVKKDGETLHGASVIMAGAVLMGRQIHLGRGVLIEGGATIKSPAIIDDQTEVRQGAYIRGYCLTGKRCVVGHATEVKHSIFLNDAKAGHFAYLGDSILGTNANLGAGTKFANLRFIPGNVTISVDRELIDTGRRKFGAILGDEAQTGCNSVTNPGTLIGKYGILMPNTTASSGYHPSRKIIR